METNDRVKIVGKTGEVLFKEGAAKQGNLLMVLMY